MLEQNIDENSTTSDVTQMSDEELETALVAVPDTPETPTETPPSDTTTTPDETPAPALSIEEQLKIANEKIDKFEQRMRDKDSYIGTSRARIQELEALVSKSRDELSGKTLDVNNYSKFSEMVRAEEELKTEQQKLTEHENKQKIDELVPDLGTLTEYIIQVGRELGDSEDTIKAFKENPYRFDPLAVARVAREARYKKQLDELSKGKQLADSLNDRVTAAAQSTTLTNSAGSSTTAQRTLSDAEIRSLSDAELDAFLRSKS